MSRIFGVIIGGTIGAIIGFLYREDAAAIPGTGSLTGSSVDAIIAGALLGILGGMLVSYLIGKYASGENPFKNAYGLNKSELQLREEQLDIARKRIKKAGVTVHREILREVKHIDVPVTREDIVIEKTVPDNKASGGNDESIETIRIPVIEERIEVIRHPEIREKVSVYSQEIHETQHVEETLKKEKLQVKTTGESDAIKKDIKE